NLQRLRTNKAQDGPSVEDRPPKAAGDFLPQHSLDRTQSSGLWIFSSLIDFSRCLCRILACLDIPAVFWLSGTLLAVFWLSRTSRPFSGFMGHSCHLAFSDIPAVF
ncbi:hypothetical protein Taro_010795, partial [Colocasia esculenta]|nr:hypothetical protein [Colocasia esculenta]